MRLAIWVLRVLMCSLPFLQLLALVLMQNAPKGQTPYKDQHVTQPRTPPIILHPGLSEKSHTAAFAML